MLRRAMMWDNTINNTPRPRRTQECFEVQCSSCNRLVEIPIEPPFHCPRCGERLDLAWGQEG